MKPIKRTRTYRLPVQASDDTLEWLLCDLFSRPVALTKALPALRETGAFRGCVKTAKSGASIFVDIYHMRGTFILSFDVTTHRLPQLSVALDVVSQMLAKTDAVQLSKNEPFSVQCEPALPGATDGGRPTRPRDENTEQLRLELPAIDWNLLVLPALVDALTATPALRDVPPVVRDMLASLDAPDKLSVEVTSDSKTGYRHVYLSSTEPLKAWGASALHPVMVTLFAHGSLYYTAHPLDDGEWLEADTDVTAISSLKGGSTS